MTVNGRQSSKRRALGILTILFRKKHTCHQFVIFLMS